jgi:hypothetical protein
MRRDVNAAVGGYLRDLAFAQSTPPKMFGYKRAAAAILALETPLTEFLHAGGVLTDIPGIGPGSARVIAEVLDTGESPTIERAIDASGRRVDIERRRALRAHFLSRAEVLRILNDPAYGEPQPIHYNGDLQMHSEWSDGRDSLGRSARPVKRAATRTPRSRIIRTGSRLPEAYRWRKPPINAARSNGSTRRAAGASDCCTALRPISALPGLSI